MMRSTITVLALLGLGGNLPGVPPSDPGKNDGRTTSAPAGSNVSAGAALLPSGVPVNVMAYRAAGDGRHDDTDAIDKAVAAAASGGMVYFPAGTYLVSRPIVPVAQIHFAGAGFSFGGWARVTTIKKAAGMSGPAIAFRGNQAIGSSITNLMVDGASGNAGDGIEVNSAHISLRNIGISNQGRDGLRIGDDAGTYNVNGWQLDHVITWANTRHGVYMYSGTPDCNAGTAIELVSAKNGGDGLRVGKCTGNTFIGGFYENNQGVGVHLLSGAARMKFVGGDANEGNAGGNCVIETDVREPSFDGLDCSNLSPPYVNKSIPTATHDTFIVHHGDVNPAGEPVVIGGRVLAPNVMTSYHGACSGAPTGGQSASVSGLGNSPAGGTCANYSWSHLYGTVISHGCTLRNLVCLSAQNGASVNDGVCTVYIGPDATPSATFLTCTIGTGTNCTDLNHTATATVGQILTIKIVADNPTRLSSLRAAVDCQ